MDVFEFIISIVALVLIFVTLWIVLLRKRRNDSPIQAEGQYDLDELSRMAESMGDRIGTLESILDAEVPDWREQLERGRPRTGSLTTMATPSVTRRRSSRSRMSSC